MGIHACAQSKLPDEAVRWLSRMVALCLEPDLISYTCAVDAFAKVVRTKEMLTWLEKMECARLEANVTTLNSVVNGFAKAGLADDAVAWLGAMRRRCLRLDIVSYTSAISACSRSKPPRAELATELFCRLTAEGLQPDDLVLHALRRAAGGRRLFELQSELELKACRD